MNFSEQIAKHLKEVYFGGNWCCISLRETLADVTWQEANAQVHGLNTIATLLYHVNYYVSEVSKVLEGGRLNAKDEYSFSHPVIQSAEDWTDQMNAAWKDGEKFAELISGISPEQLNEYFVDQKYGSYYRNLHGIIEHVHYHLGQISLIKKMLRTS